MVAEKTPIRARPNHFAGCANIKVLSTVGFIVIAAVVFNMKFLWLLSSMQVGVSENMQDQASSLLLGSSKRGRLGDGCYHVFLDVGSNIGMHGRFLLEPHLYPNSKSSVAHFEREFGAVRDNRDICIFTFEPNPRYYERQADLAAAYGAMGWRYVPVHAGAGDRDGNLTFYHSHMIEHDSKIEVGFSAVASKTLYGKDAVARTVPIVRLAKWVENEIHNRRLPPAPHGADAARIGPKVLMKLDIEGLEYVVFPDLLLSGVLCRDLDFLFGEFHGGEIHNFWPMNRTVENSGLFIKTGREANAYGMAMMRMIDSTVHCKTRYTLQDDESYHDDGMDLPTVRIA